MRGIDGTHGCVRCCKISCGGRRGGFWVLWNVERLVWGGRGGTIRGAISRSLVVLVMGLGVDGRLAAPLIGLRDQWKFERDGGRLP